LAAALRDFAERLVITKITKITKANLPQSHRDTEKDHSTRRREAAAQAA
jgi:hypothetical protein